MKKREPVSHIMTKNVQTVSLHDATLTEAKNIMEENNIRHLPVVSGKDLVGIISLTDIKRISYGANFDQENQVDSAIFHALTMDQVMNPQPQSVLPETTIKEVAEQLAVEEFHALPVVNKEGQLEGIVTTTDLVQFLVDQY